MALRNWKRMREAGQNADAPAAVANPWKEVPTLRQLGSVPQPATSERAEAYSDWANRMRERRAAEAAAATPAPEPEVPASSFWDPESLFEKPAERPAAEDGGAIALQAGERVQVRELLAVLELEPGATTEDVGNAYRRLAKQHHPDRYLDAEPAEQVFHAARMRQVITAYRTLRQLEKV